MKLAGKKVLVTGACGFIGSHLVERLLKQGAAPRAFVFYNSFNSWGWLDSLSPEVLKEVEIFTGDVRDPHGVKSALKSCDVVFHLAALIGIPFSYHSPDCYVDTNIKGTLNVLQAARELGCERVLITSTSEVYGTARYVPIDEDHPRQGQSPYSATKIAADFMADAFYRSFDLPVVIVRPFNTYGPRQSARAIIPTVITQLIQGAGEVRVGSLEPRRDFVFVEDTVEGFIRIAETDAAVGKDVNIATGVDISIGELVDKIVKTLNPKAKIMQENERIRPEKSEVMRLMGDNSRLFQLTGWKPVHNIDEGLAKTIDWFRKIDIGRAYKPFIYNV